MSEQQRATISRLAESLQMAQGELLSAARQVTEGDVFNLDQLGRAEAYRLIVYLEQLEVVEC